MREGQSSIQSLDFLSNRIKEGEMKIEQER